MRLEEYLRRILRRCLLKLYYMLYRVITVSREEELRARLKRCGIGVQFNGPIVIHRPGCVSIGDNVHIGHNARIRGDGGLEIGDNTHISHNVVIYTVNHRYEGLRLPYDETLEKRPVRIGRNVWIGINVTIVPGVTIGDGAIVGAGTVVDRDVPPLAIVGSQPLRILRFRDAEHYRALENAQQYGGANGMPLTQGH